MTGGRPWQNAASLAARAHRDQLRRDGRTPYFSHPARVALTVAAVFGCTDETVLAAALLHDILEDTRIDYDDLLKNFGKEVADIVSCLSKDKRMAEPEREAEYDRRLAAGPWQARLIKLADVYDNLADTAGADPTAAVLDRAQRALRLAAAEPRLAKAAEALRGAVRAVEARGGTA